MAWWATRPGLPKENDAPDSPRPCYDPSLSFFTTRSVCSSVGTTTSTEGHLHTQACVRPEWSRQGLTGKGVVLVSVDKESGKVTGARMLTSTGNKQLDGAALEAYSQWRFQPGTVSQVKIPIEFATRQKAQAPKRTLPLPAIFLLILVAVAVIAMATLKRRRAQDNTSSATA